MKRTPSILISLLSLMLYIAAFHTLKADDQTNSAAPSDPLTQSTPTSGDQPDEQDQSGKTDKPAIDPQSSQGLQNKALFFTGQAYISKAQGHDLLADAYRDLADVFTQASKITEEAEQLEANGQKETQKDLIADIKLLSLTHQHLGWANFYHSIYVSAKNEPYINLTQVAIDDASTALDKMETITKAEKDGGNVADFALDHYQAEALLIAASFRNQICIDQNDSTMKEDQKATNLVKDQATALAWEQAAGLALKTFGDPAAATAPTTNNEAPQK